MEIRVNKILITRDKAILIRGKHVLACFLPSVFALLSVDIKSHTFSFTGTYKATVTLISNTCILINTCLSITGKTTDLLFGQPTDGAPPSVTSVPRPDRLLQTTPRPPPVPSSLPGEAPPRVPGKAEAPPQR